MAFICVHLWLKGLRGIEMPKIESSVEIDAPLELVWELAQDVEHLPDIMPDLDSVQVLEREQPSPDTTRTVTQWVGRIKQFNRRVDWVEEDIWNLEKRTCSFWQLRGDFTEYKGEWSFKPQNGGTRADLVIDYRFEIPLIGAMMQRVIQKLMQENSDGMLQSLREEAEKRARTL